jgi:hypothetical protein
VVAYKSGAFAWGCLYLSRGCFGHRLRCLCGFGCVSVFGVGVFVLCCYVAGSYPIFFFLME